MLFSIVIFNTYFSHHNRAGTQFLKVGYNGEIWLKYMQILQTVLVESNQ